MNARDTFKVPATGPRKRQATDRPSAAEDGAEAVGVYGPADFSPQLRNLLDRMTPEERELVFAHCRQRKVPAGTTLFSQGTDHTVTFLIKSGIVRTYYSSPSGKEITVAYWSGGDLVGGPHFFDEPCAHVWTGKTIEDSVVLTIKGRELRELALRIPLLAECVIDALSFKLKWVSVLLQNRCTESVHQRLAQMLVRLSDMYGARTEEGILIRHQFTQEDIASMVGSTRQWVNMAFGQLQRQGLVRLKKRRLVILDIASLRRAATERGARQGAGSQREPLAVE